VAHPWVDFGEEGNAQIARQDRRHHRRQQPYRIGNGAAVCRGGRL